MGSCFGRCISKEPSPSGLWRRATDEQDAELVSNVSDKNCRRNFVYRILKFKRKQRTRQFVDKFWERQDMNYAKLTNASGQENVSNIQLQNLDVSNLLASNTFAKESALNSALGSCTNPAAVGSSSRASSSLDLEWEHEYVHLQRHFVTMMQQQQQQQQQLQCQQQQLLDKRSDSIAQATNQLMLLNGDCQNDDNESSCQLNSLNSIEREQTLPGQLLASAGAIGNISGGGGRVAQQQQMKTQFGRNSSFTRTSSHNSWSHISTPESLEWDIDEEQQRQLRVEEDDNLDHETLQLLHQIEQLKNQVLNETGDGLEEITGGIEFSAKSMVHPLMDDTLHSS